MNPAPRWLVGMESSGAIRRELRELGVDAWSCDLLPSTDDSPYHIQGDVYDIIELQRWDAAIFHPTCTYLTCSAEWAYGDGPYHQKVRPGTLVGEARRRARDEAVAGVQRLLDSGIPRIAIENPRGVLSSRIRKPDQTIQPYEYGDDASKATCLWLVNLPPLVPTARVPGRMVNGKERWTNQTDSGQNRLTPGPNRWRERSMTYPGIAKAIATQWGLLDTE